MSRPRTYDPDEVLNRAVRVFWEKGYRHTTVEDLVEGTGVQRYGLYESFGDKHGLFLAALERYESDWVGQMLEELEDPDASLPGILSVFAKLRAAVTTETAPPGCLLCNTASELADEDPEAAAIVGRYVERLREGFRAALERARARGELPPEIDPPTRADYLAGVVLGSCVYVKTPAGPEAVRTFLDAAVATLR